MKVRSHRLSLAARNPPISPADSYGALRFTRPVCTGRLHWWVRTGALLSVIGLMRVTHAVRTRWWPVLAGGVLTFVGLMLRGSPGSVVLLPGLLLLLSAPLVLPGPQTDRMRRRKLERELAAYSTPAQRCDLEMILDRYPNDITYELRDILATQALADGKNEIPGSGRY